MFYWSKPKENTTPTNLQGKYIAKNKEVVVRKMDEIDIEFIKRHFPDVYKEFSGYDEILYIFVDEFGSLKIMNEDSLTKLYVKVWENK